MEHTATVQDLKEKLFYMTEREPSKKGPLPVSDQFLSFNGSALVNEYRLSEYSDIQNGEIQFTIKIPDNYDPYKKNPIYKGSNPVETEDVYKLKEAIDEVTDYPPDHQMRVVYKGKASNG
ncbi:hypothetical protein INT45_014220 [Circinella minor]|uniref:Ubiquitin-like domain-containing protein n=1 Tax=Circinella minor TaxID=1195481 RepID=A0A8H7VKV5_9FUNG|nr:hypothetical protein INT45_014220 [Circinella minor]